MTPVGCALVLHAYAPEEESELTMATGDMIDVFECDQGDDWWFGVLNDCNGWFPSAYVRLARIPDWKSSFRYIRVTCYSCL